MHCPTCNQPMVQDEAHAHQEDNPVHPGDPALVAMEVSSPAAIALKEANTRFLYPFFFDRRQTDKAAPLLLAHKLGKFDSIWECCTPHEHYHDDMLDHVTSFLFSPGASGPCMYLRLKNIVGDAIFHNTVSDFNGATVRVKLARNAQVELFLTCYGVGVLSVGLSPGVVDTATLMDFNYRLSLLPPIPSHAIRIPHPRDDEKRWEKIPEAHRSKTAPPPAADAPLVERLGAAGGLFALPELVDLLLKPLEGLGLRPVQQNFSVYTVARFGEEMDLEQAGVRRRMGPILAGLAQVEETNHAGAISTLLPVANGILNRRHWAAAGQLGAAQFVADQPAPQGKPEHPFNDQRVPRVFLKYFIPYLMALIQRLTLHRAVDEANRFIFSGKDNAAGWLANLRSDLLRFSMGGHFTQVSVRDALHRFYQISRHGLDVAAAWDEARRAIAEIDAHRGAIRQEKIATDMAKNLGIVAHTQQLIEWIEVFLVSVYAAHLYHMSFGQVDHNPWYTICVAGAAGLLAALYLEPWSGRT